MPPDLAWRSVTSASRLETEDSRVELSLLRALTSDSRLAFFDSRGAGD
ncbi:hypothetical protein H8E65_02430 [Candidatus Bathyarchaeota archaeon]|nr:hypothetical protein [Candidatus Bathyarchaeota archaeon]